MKKFYVIFLIIFLISFTAVVKNSTKRINDQIFTVKENIRSLKKDYENIKLENDYLSSAEKLLEFQNMYFEDELIKKDIRNIKIIEETMGNFKIEQFKFANE
tara:strand:- start:192 stop:497 length:306 start_codon:yes stop_codon:yes gene_type:complete